MNKTIVLFMVEVSFIPFFYSCYTVSTSVMPEALNKKEIAIRHSLGTAVNYYTPKMPVFEYDPIIDKEKYEIDLMVNYFFLLRIGLPEKFEFTYKLNYQTAIPFYFFGNYASHFLLLKYQFLNKRMKASIFGGLNIEDISKMAICDYSLISGISLGSGNIYSGIQYEFGGNAAPHNTAMMSTMIYCGWRIPFPKKKFLEIIPEVGVGYTSYIFNIINDAQNISFPTCYFNVGIQKMRKIGKH